MATLVEFINARLDELEHGARAAATYSAEWCTADEFNETVLLDANDALGHTFDSVYGQIAPHIARHDPAYVLADVESKRAIIALHSRKIDTGLDDVHGNRGYACKDCRHLAPCPTLRHLAAPFADHPDFDPAWAVR